IAIGFFSHLLLDELYSGQWSGVRITLKKSAGSALKLFGPEFTGNAVAYMLLAGLTIVTLTEAGIIGPADAPPRSFVVESSDVDAAAPPEATTDSPSLPAGREGQLQPVQSIDGY